MLWMGADVGDFIGTGMFGHLAGICQASPISLLTYRFTAELCNQEVLSLLKLQGHGLLLGLVGMQSGGGTAPGDSTCALPPPTLQVYFPSRLE